MKPDPESALWGQLILIVILTLVNAFFAAAEIAVVSLNRTQTEAQAKEGNKKAQRLMKILGNSSHFLATIQVAITFAGFLSSASAATTLAGYLEPLFGNASWGHEAAVVIITLILSYFSLVFGELYPKQVALQKTEAVAKATVVPVQWVGVVLRPFVWLLSVSTNFLMKITPIKFTEQKPAMTRDEMITVIESGKDAGVLDKDEYEMFEGIITLNKKMAREVMVPRTDAFMVDLNTDDSTNIDTILGQRFSRIPVYKGDKDQVVGIVHIRNLLKKARETGFDNLHLADVMQEPMFVPETIYIDDLLLEMRKSQQQMAILLDEYGGIVGLATIEDLVEEIVGEIDDETDQAETLVQTVAHNEYLVAGHMPLDEFNEQFHTDLQADEVDTIAGYMLAKLSVIPSNGQHLEVKLDNGICLTTGQMAGSRLVNLTVHLPEAAPVSEATTANESEEVHV
ncbi:hemolysin [Lactobacillus selangorensis]|uniref:Hemolysin n=1 Tax=Lactobacillus selangorensis TaxID=81857 RepID=A0A0R2FJG5_9LACO|nr:hemolysin family protein [Lactobacillus selangorensis]KRN28414.1 hemolysin [Lactobacillus selangorensis]KRN31915.1 hemolysin [Lactobacillus selangorensis]